jgi:hypothetical protein
MEFSKLLSRMYRPEILTTEIGNSVVAPTSQTRCPVQLATLVHILTVPLFGVSQMTSLVTSRTLTMAVLMFATSSGAEATNTVPPTSIVVRDDGEYATMLNQLHPGNRIGYRFHEHTPIISGEAPLNKANAATDSEAVETMIAGFEARAGAAATSLTIAGEGWVPQTWKFYLRPADDGIELSWVVETAEIGLNRYYGVQQCFRLSGKDNQEWRRAIAETPAFSEFDSWNAAEKEGKDKASLTYVVRNGAWQSLPAMHDTVGARTPLGVKVDVERSGGKIKTIPEVGPYHARMLDPVDSGLIARVNKDKTWICGLYWQHTSHITDHHPADCLHAIVNIGGVLPHSQKVLLGKIYWFQGSLDDLLTHWRRDFPCEAAD